MEAKNALTKMSKYLFTTDITFLTRMLNAKSQNTLTKMGFPID